MTSKPFGVNITLLPAITPPDYVGYAKVIVDEGVKIVETAGNNPRPVIEVLRSAPYKVYILHKCYIPQSTQLTVDAPQSAMRYLRRSSGLISYQLMDLSVQVIPARMTFLD